MSEGPFKTLRNLAIVALVALLIALAPGGGTGLSVALWILTVLISASGLLYLLTPMRHLRDLPQRSQPNPSAHASSS